MYLSGKEVLLKLKAFHGKTHPSNLQFVGLLRVCVILVLCCNIVLTFNFSLYFITCIIHRKSWYTLILVVTFPGLIKEI